MKTFSARRDRRQGDFVRAPLLRDLFPDVAEIRIELRFADGSTAPLSPQRFGYFPAARAFFQFPCPCHACSGDFDLTAAIRAAATRPKGTASAVEHRRCAGQRTMGTGTIPCPMEADIHVSVVAQPAPPQRG